ncbi:MAG TPA: family 1 glycosylhydrolase [Nannocystaceae bacterium]|nr:family 1 glycosylhydrolase [Nannocystaceae bacterium]
MRPLALALAAGYAGLVRVLDRADPEIRWDWSHLDLDDLHFPREFLWGVATSAHQVEGGCTNNQWSRFEGEPGRIKGGHRSGAACEHWQRYPEDIALMKALGVRAYRFSVEWSKIEPAPGRFDDAALAHYVRVCEALRAAGIAPVVTLHHFTHPLWFEDSGAFVDRRNHDAFVRFAGHVFDALHPHVELWCTINEPEVVAMEGYLRGTFPPGERDPQRAAEVLHGLLAAHAACYHALKGRPGGAAARVGLVKNVFHFDPDRRWHLGDWAAARAAHRFFNGAALDALASGRFRMRIPGMARLDRTIDGLPESLDFLGLNYYSQVRLRVDLGARERVVPVTRPEDVPTDMPYAIYAEGLYRAIHQVAALGRPIYVTENGIADAADDRRALFLRRYLYALSRAVREGLDVRGYFYWSLMDNFEWAEGYDMRFGLHEVDFATQERRLRAGARPFVDTVRRFSAAAT